MLIMVLVYTVLGGMVSVVVNDFIQFTVLSTGMIIGSIYVIQKIGWDKLFEVPAGAQIDSWFNPISKKEGNRLIKSILFLSVHSYHIFTCRESKSSYQICEGHG